MSLASPNSPTSAGPGKAPWEELIARFGPPTSELRAGTGHMLTWTVPSGDGVICARSNKREAAGEDDVAQQLLTALDYCDRYGLVPGEFVALCGVSGVVARHQRPDLDHVERAVSSNAGRFVVWGSVDRISRSDVVMQLHRDALRTAGASLHLLDFGRAVDWQSDYLTLEMLHLMGRAERKAFERRTRSALLNKYVLQGRGWPGRPLFGFRRDADGFLEVDPENWHWVAFAFANYAEVGSLPALARRMYSAGGPKLSAMAVRRVLTNPTYVTGRWSMTYQGKRHDGRPVILPLPIPQSLFDDVQGKLASGRKR